jgi:hypothetical protein
MRIDQNIEKRDPYAPTRIRDIEFWRLEKLRPTGKLTDAKKHVLMRIIGG